MDMGDLFGDIFGDFFGGGSRRRGNDGPTVSYTHLAVYKRQEYILQVSRFLHTADTMDRNHILHGLEQWCTISVFGLLLRCGIRIF